jgi:predicted ribosome quality control (RQC) complex YloA/Tae2 family protein
MQTNYYFLRHLSARLSTELRGLVLAECFSQEKDELVLGFCTEGKQWKKRREFYIKAVIRPDFVCLNFPEEFRRASKNSVDLFAELIDLPVLGLRQFLNERAFAIEFEQGYVLLFKLFGNRSNLILFQHGAVKDLFHSKLLADTQLQIEQLDRPLDQGYDAFVKAHADYRKLFPTWGKYVAQQLTELSSQPEVAWAQLERVREQLEHPSYHLCILDHQPILTLLPVGEVRQTFDDPLTASNEFYYAYTRLSSLEQEKGALLRGLQKRKDKTTAYVAHQYQKLEYLENGVKHEEIGHILMAYLHEIPEKAEVVEVFDFYRDKNIKIKLKTDLSPQRNAEVYYRKAKNEKIEIEKITENIEQKEQEIATLELHIQHIEAAENLKVLRKYIKDNQLDTSEKAPQTTEQLFRRMEYMGFEILIGRNAKNNDLLTQRYARKEDLWLHARDVAGSHVVIRHQAGKKIPNPVVERAAQLAAYYSKRKNDSLCPVIVTPRKYVRKTRDLTDGQVIVDKEEVVMVEPAA